MFTGVVYIVFVFVPPMQMRPARKYMVRDAKVVGSIPFDSEAFFRPCNAVPTDRPIAPWMASCINRAKRTPYVRKNMPSDVTMVANVTWPLKNHIFDVNVSPDLQVTQKLKNSVQNRIFRSVLSNLHRSMQPKSVSKRRSMLSVWNWNILLVWR